VRLLIQALKKKKTVLLSTHILPKPNRPGTGVLIIHSGQDRADGAPDAWASRALAAAGCG